MIQKRPRGRPRKQRVSTPKIKPIPYPPSSEQMRASTEVRKAVSDLINNPVFVQVYSVLVNERPSKELGTPPGLVPSTLAGMQMYSQGYEDCLKKLLKLAEAPPEPDNEPMTFGLKPNEVEDL